MPSDTIGAGSATHAKNLAGTGSAGAKSPTGAGSATGISPTTAAELARIPAIDEWPGLDTRERERRARVLADIRQRVVERGPHRAAASPERGKLFMPFAALKGYDDLVKDVEDE